MCSLPEQPACNVRLEHEPISTERLMQRKLGSAGEDGRADPKDCSTQLDGDLVV